jgi:hypothetical protein
LRQLQALPAHKNVNYSQEYACVTRNSTINVKRAIYTVPSRLVNQVKVHVYDDRLDLFLGQELKNRLERVYAPGAIRKRSVNYKNVINMLVKISGVFRCSQWRDESLPNVDYRTIWQYANDASRYKIRILHLANRLDNEMRLGRFITGQLDISRLPEAFGAKPKHIPKMNVIAASIVAIPVVTTRRALCLMVMLKQLRLSAVAEQWEAIANNASHDRWRPEQYLSELCHDSDTHTAIFLLGY